MSRTVLEEMRLMAVDRMNESESPAAVAASFGLHRGWGYKVRAKAKGRGRGKRAVLSTRATGRPRTLTPEQERKVFVWVNGKNPRQYGFDFGLWTRQIVQELIAQKFGVDLSLASISALLARMGLTPQKPLQQACQRDPVAVAQWQGISAASAVNSKGGFWFTTYSGGLNGERFVELLGQMIKGRRRLIHLVLDGLPAHKTKAVRTYVESLNGKLTLHSWLCARPQSGRAGLELRQANGSGAQSASGG